MSAPEEPNQERRIVEWSAYLRTLARVTLIPTIAARVDVSGVIQQSLLEANQACPVEPFQSNDVNLALVRRIFINNLNDEIRKLKAEMRDIDREVRLDDALADSSARIDAWLAIDDSTPSKNLMRSEEAVALSAAIDRLPESQRDAIILHHWHGWKLDQIASHMNRSKSAVAGLLKRGLEQLRCDFGEAETRIF